MAINITDDPGTDKCIGTVEDLKGDTVVSFIWNSVGRHRIMRYYPATGITVELLEWAGLNFRSDKPVFGAVVDNLLYFTDGYWTSTAWNEPRKLNMTRKSLYDSLKTTLPTFINRIRRPPMFPLLVERKNVPYPLYDNATAYLVGDRVSYSFPENIEIEGYEAIANTTGHNPQLSTYWKPVNNSNRARQGAFQFAYRYVYLDHEISVFSPWSKLIPYPSDGKTSTKLVRLTIPNEELAFPTDEVDKIELVFRNGNAGAPSVCKTFDRRHGQALGTFFDFYNTNIGVAIPDTESGKAFDSVPITSDDNAVARDRLFDVGYREGYDPAAAKASLSFSINQGLTELTGITVEPISFNYHEQRTDGEGENIYPGTDFYALLDDGLYHILQAYDEVTHVGNVTPGSVAFGQTLAQIIAYFSLYPYSDPVEGVVVTDATISVESSETSGQRVFKQLSQYQYGIAFYDWANRTAGVDTSENWIVNIPKVAILDQINLTVRWTLSPADAASEIPIWAHYWRIVRKKNLTVSFFLQGTFADIYYIEDSNPDAIAYSRTNNGYEDVVIDISSLSTKGAYGTQGIGYIFNPGDRLRFFREDLGTYYDRPIKSQDGVRLRFAFFEFGELFSFPAGNSITLPFEIYTPYQGEVNEPFYEIGNTYAIINPGQPSRSYGTTTDLLTGDVYIASQTVSLYITGTGVAHGGDLTFGRQPSFEQVEAMSPWQDHYSEWLTDIGRTNLDVDSKQVYKTRNTRFSNKYVSGTEINGLSSFEALNEKPLPVEIGPLKKLQLASNAQSEGTVMLAVAENEVVSMYLSEAQFRDTQGSTIVAISGEVIGSVNVLRGGVGTINPESVVYDGYGRVYGFDMTRGEPWRYSNDGVTLLATTYLMRSFFYVLGQLLLPYKSSTRIYGGYDVFHKEYLMTFIPDPSSLIPSVTIAFNERVNRFTSTYSFLPEMYAKSNTLLFSFLNGNLWQHHDSPLYNNFYGVQHPYSLIRFVANGNSDGHASQKKVWQGHAVEGNRNWPAVKITNDDGMESHINARWYENREGTFYAAIRRDKKTPGYASATLALNKGREMRSQAITIEIQNTDTDLARLDYTDVFYIESSGGLV